MDRELTEFGIWFVGLAGTVLISLIPRQRVRRSLLVLWAFVPIIAFFLFGFGQGCFPPSADSHCYWFGFGFVLLVMFGLPAWWIGMAIALVAIYFWKKRETS